MKIKHKIGLRKQVASLPYFFLVLEYYTTKGINKMSSPFSTPQSELHLGFHYFVYGWKLIIQRRLLPFVLLPLLINVLLLTGLFWFFVANIVDWSHWLVSFMPTWLEWLTYLIVPLAVFSVLIVFYFIFTTLANFIAAPFNAFLAEKVELQLTNEPLTSTGLAELMKDVPRMLNREWKKMWYSLPRLVGLFLLSWLPFIGQTVVPVLTFIFSAWLLAIQYCDYPFDNHKISFSRMRNALEQRRVMNLTFGALVSLFTMIPGLNLVIMPVAVCGATAMWVREYRPLFVSEGDVIQTQNKLIR